MRRKRLRKKSKSEASKRERALWDLCKQIIRKKYPNTCYTCGKTGLQGSNWHTGHMWPKASLSALLKYEIRILRPQCYHCNMNLGGMGAVFYERMTKEMGKRHMNMLDKLKIKSNQETTKATDHYIKLIKKYTKILEKLNKDGQKNTPI